MFVKVCGITRAEDADAVAELGGSAIGFIFWPGSPRYVAPDQARQIVRQKPPGLMSVGVFVDEPIELVRQLVEVVGLDAVQLHGHESAAYCRELRCTCIKAVGLKDGQPAAVDTFDDEVLILVDAHDPQKHGGTGRTVNWDRAQQIAATRKTILSGGLTADNVAAAISLVRPYGIDVSSGVESAPGVKDRRKLEMFFEALNG